MLQTNEKFQKTNFKVQFRHILRNIFEI